MTATFNHDGFPLASPIFASDYCYYAEFPRTITVEMIARLDAWRPSHAVGMGTMEAIDRCVWNRIEAIERQLRQGDNSLISARLFLLNAFTHEVRALILTAVVRLGQDHRDQAKCGCRCFSPAQLLSSMYKAQRIAEPDAPVQAILQSIVESLHA